MPCVSFNVIYNDIMAQIFRISGLGMVILLVSLLSWATPASAGTASWSAESIPDTTDNILGPAGIDVRDFAVAPGGTTIYAVPSDSISNNIIYKSTSSGVRWTALNVPVKADLVAIASDNTNMVAIVDSSTAEVYLTTNGGTTWDTLGTPQESGADAAAAIYDLAISKASAGIHYIAAAGKEAGDIANLWYFESGTAAPAWTETNTLTGFSSADAVTAVAFSPNFQSDEALLAISEKDNVSVVLQILSLNTRKWDSNAGFSGYPVTVVSGSGISDLDSASISLAPDYLADDDDLCTIFIGLAVSGDNAAQATSGIYRICGTTKTTLKTDVKIRSIAFDGTNLVAGSYDTTTVYRSADPMATTPTISTVSNMKGPGGQNKTVVAWAGTKVVAGTSGNESAFAVSTNNGDTFNDISLIDTAITYARDAAVSADGSKIYLVTDDGTDLSLWRRASTWERILSQQGTTNCIVRIAPEDANIIFLAKKDASTLYYNDSGRAKGWIKRTCRVNIQDLVVESAAVVYALDSAGLVSKTTNAGLFWGTATPTTLGSSATIVSISPDKLLVGSQNGYVAYSTDGNLSWTKIPEVLQGSAGQVQVAADENFATNKIIYAASDTTGQNIKKWQIGTSTAWTDIFKDTIPGGIYGLAINDNTLYALEFNSSTGQSTLWKHLSPTTITSSSLNWSHSTTTASTDIDDTEVHLNAAPRALKVSRGKEWAVKTNNTNKLYSFTDIAIEITSTKPLPGFVNPVNAKTGLAYDIAFKWDRPTGATAYELQIALDSQFFILIGTVVIATDKSPVFLLVGPNQTGDARIDFMPGSTYYWRVRTTQPSYSEYSEAQSFHLAPLRALVPELSTPANGSTDISRKPYFSWEPVAGASEYHFVLGDNATMTSPIINIKVENTGLAVTQELDYGTTYFWKVRATKPAGSDWSTLANFTVRKESIEPVPQVVVKQMSPVIINLPELPPQKIIIFTPPPAPQSAVPDYLRVAIIIMAVLLLAIIALIIKPFTVLRPIPVIEGLSGRLGKLREGLATYFQDFQPIRSFKEAKAHAAGADEVEAGRPISFAAKSFLRMMTSEKEGQKPLLPTDEEQILGRRLASKIQTVAKKQMLYQKFPEDAPLFLHIWSQYGSRNKTNRYLINSFKSRPENAIGLLKCYLPNPEPMESGLRSKKGFNRSQYDLLAKVVDADKVYDALTRVYGPELDRIEDEAAGDYPDKAIASQFAHIHHLVKREIAKADKKTRTIKAG